MRFRRPQAHPSKAGLEQGMKHHYHLSQCPQPNASQPSQNLPKGLVKVQWLDPTPESDSF